MTGWFFELPTLSYYLSEIKIKIKMAQIRKNPWLAWGVCPPVAEAPSHVCSAFSPSTQPICQPIYLSSPHIWSFASFFVLRWSPCWSSTPALTAVGEREEGRITRRRQTATATPTAPKLPRYFYLCLCLCLCCWKWWWRTQKLQFLERKAHSNENLYLKLNSFISKPFRFLFQVKTWI